MPTPINNAGLFLVSTLFDLYLFVLAIRFFLCYARINYFHPATQFIIKLTQPLVGPVRRVIPTTKGIEFSTLVIMYLIEIIKFLVIGLLLMGVLPHFLGILILGFADLAKLFLNFLTYTILLQAILSWLPQTAHSPITQFLNQIAYPVLRPIQKLIPPLGGFDLSPIFALIILQLINILIIAPIGFMGANIAFG